MSYLQLTYFHLGTVFPAFLLGAYLLMSAKGTPRHKFLGKVYMSLMLVTALTTLFMSAEVGPALFGHFGFVHLLSFLVLYSVSAAFCEARKGNIQKHQAHMMGVYFGGVLVAGVFTFLPGRLLHDWVITPFIGS